MRYYFGNKRLSNLNVSPKRNFSNYPVMPYQYCILLCATHAYASLHINMHYMAYMGGVSMINMLIISLGTSICTFACKDGLRKIEYKQKAECVTGEDRSQSYRSNTGEDEGVLFSCFNRGGQKKKRSFSVLLMMESLYALPESLLRFN